MDLLQRSPSFDKLVNEILSCVEASVVLANLEGEILFASPSIENLLGFTPAELHGRNFSVFFTPEDLEYLPPNLLYLARKSEPFEGELMLRRKNGTRFFVYWVSRTYIDDTGDEPIMVIYIQDIDNLKTQEKTLRENNYEDLVRVADGLAHELRNPLVGIAGFVNKLYKACRTLPNHDRYYTYVVDNLKKIERLVKDVESLAHLPEPSFAEESVKDVIQEALQPYHLKMKELDIDLTLSLEEVTLYMDADLFTQALSILIQNALDALQGGGKISIRSETKDNQCKIYVTDTGSGISPKDIPYIFYPLFSTKSDSVGMGLAVVKRIVSMHGGYVEVTSEQGKGTTFGLMFPVERRRPIRVSLLGSAVS